MGLLGLNDSLKERIENQQNQIRQAAEIPPDENTKGRQKMKLLKLKEVLEITACGKTKLYAMINADEFPRPYKIGAASRWRLDEVENWIKTRPVS